MPPSASRSARNVWNARQRGQLTKGAAGRRAARRRTSRRSTSSKTCHRAGVWRKLFSSPIGAIDEMRFVVRSPSRPSANARGGAIDAVRGWCAGLGRGVKRLTSAIVHASSAASEVRDVELTHTGHRRRSGAVGVEAGRPRRAPRISARCISRRCGAAAGPALGETSPSSGVPTLGPRL